MKTGEWTLRSRRVVTPSGIRAADILIRNETIAGLLEHDGPEAEGVILDVGDLAVLPGLVALHREGSDTFDGRRFEAATRGAGAGGVTTLVDLPQHREFGPAASSGLLDRMAEAEGKIRVDWGLVVPLGHGNVDQVESWVEAGIVGVEAFREVGHRDSFPVSTEADLRAAMPILAALGRPLLVDSGRISLPAAVSTEADPFALSLPDREFAAIRLLIRLCRETRCRVHLIRPTASEALPMIAEARAGGLPLTVETCPYHLGFAPDEIVDGVPTFPLHPGLRELDVRDRLWEGLASGLIDAIGPDSPRSFVTSIQPIPEGDRPAHLDDTTLRLALPAAWAEARRRGFTLPQVAGWLAANPSNFVGLGGRKGAIAPGLDADLVVFDPDALPCPGTELLRRRQGHPEPSAGRMLAGRVEATILRGTMIYQDGQFFDPPRGSVLFRLEETQPIPGTDA